MNSQAKINEAKVCRLWRNESLEMPAQDQDFSDTTLFLLLKKVA
jgi:hypothetical protein